MKNRIGFWLLMIFLAFISGRIISPAVAAPVADQKIEKQLTGDINGFLEVLLQRYWTKRVKEVLMERIANLPKKSKGIEI